VTIDGEPVIFANQPPTAVGIRVLVPVRGVFEAIGFDVGWDTPSQTVTLTSDEYIVKIVLESDVFTTNGVPHELDVPAQGINGSVMLPIRRVLESVGYAVSWDSATDTVVVESPAPISVPTDYEKSYAVFELINSERVNRNLPKLTWNSELANSAQKRMDNGRPVWIENLVGNAIITGNNISIETAVDMMLSNEHNRTQILNPSAVSLGIGYQLTTNNESSLQKMQISLYFATATETPSVADPYNIENMKDDNRIPISSIELPNRRLTETERLAWIDEYKEMGGYSAFELEVVRLINIERQRFNLQTVEIDDTLMMASRFYAQIKATQDVGIGHNIGPYATNPSASHGASANVAEAFGGRLRWNGGNSGGGYRTPESLVTGWMNSDGHRRYILSPEHRYIGIGLAVNDDSQFGVYQYMYLSDNPSR
jgi:uncharacterized protein YkwD